MKHLLSLSAILFLLSHQMYAQGTSLCNETTSFTVHLKGLSSDEGSVKVGLYDQKDQWLKQVYKMADAKILDGAAIVVLDSVPNGTYGISCYHDLNGNDTLDTKYFGIPSEPYACSNGAVGRFGPPAWVDAKLIISAEHTETNIQF